MIINNSTVSYKIVAIVGTGNMGAGIAQLAAQAGHIVKLFDLQPKAAQQALMRIEEDLKQALMKGRISTKQHIKILERILIAESLQELATADLVIEAIAEHLDVKRALFTQLEAIVKKETILASNTSSLSITALAYGLAYPQRVIGWHFFNPATRMRLVEIIAGVDTDPKYLNSLYTLSEMWGKKPVYAPNTPGFIVNRVARPFYAESLRLLAEDITSIMMIDYVVRECGGFAMGPFELMDLIGIDVNLSVTESVFVSTAYDTRYAPHVLQQELVRAGRWGRKNSMGFYDYRQIKNKIDLDTEFVQPVFEKNSLEIAEEMDLLWPLIYRLQTAGVTVSSNPQLSSQTCILNTSTAAILIALTEGKTAAEYAYQNAMPCILIDLAYDFSKIPVLAVTASQHGKAGLGSLAAILQRASMRLIELNDVAGMIVMRLVSCLINEAADLMTWTRTSAMEIDTAMQLGTAYPYGPLTWADKLDPKRVIACLAQLQNHYGDIRYRCAPKLRELLFTGGKFYE